MENNENNPKPQSTGGLKLMTVFIAVLALHVVVIGGFAIHGLLASNNPDADLVSDKTHKSVKVTPDNATVSDGQLPDGMNGDKSAADASADVTSPMTIPSPAPAAFDTAAASTPAPATAVAPTSSAPVAAPAAASSSPAASTASREPTASAPSGPIQSGPVITPPASSAPAVAAEGTASPAAPEAEPEVSPETTGGTPYVVKSHDTLARIARQHHVKVAALRLANSLKNDFLHIGQKLVIPARAHEEGAGLASLREPNTTLLGDSIPDSTKPASHDKAGAAATGGRHLYIVSKGDTVIRIARKFHTSSSAIMVLNNISDARKLRLGQKLKIPSQEARSATSAPAARAQPEDRIEPRATPAAQLANFVP